MTAIRDYFHIHYVLSATFSQYLNFQKNRDGAHDPKWQTGAINNEIHQPQNYLSMS